MALYEWTEKLNVKSYRLLCIWALIAAPAKNIGPTYNMKTSRFNSVVSSILDWEHEGDGERERERQR